MQLLLVSLPSVQFSPCAALISQALPVFSVCYSLSNDTFPAGAGEVNSPQFHVCSLAGVCHGAGAAALAGNPALPSGLGISKHTHSKCTSLKPVSISLHQCTNSLVLFITSATSWSCNFSGETGAGFTNALGGFGCVWVLILQMGRQQGEKEKSRGCFSCCGQ